MRSRQEKATEKEAEDIVALTGNTGFIMGYDQSARRFRWLRLSGKHADSAGLFMTDITADFTKKLQQETVFAAIPDAKSFSSYGSHPFFMTTRSVEQIEQTIGPTSLRTSPLYRKEFQTKEEFLRALLNYQQQYMAHEALFLKSCAFFQMSAGGFEFLLSPHQFDKSSLFLWKIGRCSILDAVRQKNIDGKIAETIEKALQKAKDECGNIRAEYQYFVHALNDPGWNGAVFLNCPLSANSENPALSMLLSGVDEREEFLAHHLMIPMSLNQIKEGSLDLLPASIHAVIDYENLLVSDVPGCEAGFHTTQIFVEIADSKVSSFTAACELFMYQAFGSPLLMPLGTKGNAMRLMGRHQQENGIDLYRFSLKEEVLYSCKSGGITDFTVTDVQMNFEKDKESER